MLMDSVTVKFAPASASGLPHVPLDTSRLSPIPNLKVRLFRVICSSLCGTSSEVTLTLSSEFQNSASKSKVCLRLASFVYVFLGSLR